LIKAQPHPGSKRSQTPERVSPGSQSHSDRQAQASPRAPPLLGTTCQERALVFKEEEGGGGDYHLYGTEHCLQVSLFNEKQNSPPGTQSTLL